RILVTVRFAIARARYGFVDRPPLYRAPARVQEEGRNCGQCQRNSCTSRRPALSKTRDPGSSPAPGPTGRSPVARSHVAQRLEDHMPELTPPRRARAAPTLVAP